MAIVNSRAAIEPKTGKAAIFVNETIPSLMRKLFSNGEQGFFYDPNDLSTMYQDAAGTVPVTAVGQPVGLVLDKSRGLVFGNELNPNPSFNTDLRGWSTGSASSAVFDNGEARVTFGGTLGNSANNWFYLNGTNITGKWYEATFEATHVSGGNLQAGFGYIPGFTVSGAENAGVKKKYTFRGVSLISNPNTLLSFGATSAGSVWKIDNVSVKELAGNHAYQTTSASRPILRQNATTGAYYLEFDGSDDFLQTANIDFTATDKVSLFTGVRKLSDASIASLMKFGTGASIGRFEVLMPPNINSTRYEVGTDSSWAHFNMGASPTSGVVVGFINRTAESSANGVILSRFNGAGNPVLINSSTNATGNLGRLPLFIGRRDGTAYPMNMHLYSLIGIGRLTTGIETASIEKELAKRTGVTLSV